DVFVSLWVAYPEAATYRGVHFMRSYWRLKPDITLPQAQADLSRIGEGLAKLYPEEERDRQRSLAPLHQAVVGDGRPALLILFWGGGICAANCMREFRRTADGPRCFTATGVCDSRFSRREKGPADSPNDHGKCGSGGLWRRRRSGAGKVGHKFSGVAQAGGAGTRQGNSYGCARVPVRPGNLNSDWRRLRTHAGVVGGAA